MEPSRTKSNPAAPRAPATTAPGARTLDVQTGDAVKQWVELKQTYLALRGARPGRDQKAIPRTTYHDVMQIATAWTGELRKVHPRSNRERREHERWIACAEQVASKYDRSRANLEYPDNERFWQDCTARLAVYLESRKVVPSRWQLLRESFVEAVAELPATIGRAGAEVADGVAGLIKEPAKLVAVVLGAALVLPPVLRALRG